jgi:hypothetical protein
LSAAALAAVPATGTKPADSTLTVTGKLATGIMAIGAETTGVTITTAQRQTYELDIKDAALKRTADGLDGKEVTVTGTLTIKAGVEVAQRRIIAVKTLEAAKPAGSAPASAPK